MLTLTRDLCFIDIETTGLDVTKDRIVQLGVLKCRPDGSTRPWSGWFNPGMPIPAEATEVHGITDADVADCPTFASAAAGLHRGLEGCDLAGFNLLQFDIPLLAEEFDRAGIEFSLDGRSVVDAGVIFKKREPRTLEAAMKFYCGQVHKEAHSALDDAVATKDVLLSQIDHYADMPATVEELALEYRYDGQLEPVDIAGKFVRDTTGTVLFGFGKWNGQPAHEHLDYVGWMLCQQFTMNTKRVCRKLRNNGAL